MVEWYEFLDMKVLIMFELKSHCSLPEFIDGFLKIPQCRLLYQEQCDWYREQPPIIYKSNTKESPEELQTSLKPLLFLIRYWMTQKKRDCFVTNEEYPQWEWIRHDREVPPKELTLSKLSK